MSNICLTLSYVKFGFSLLINFAFVGSGISITALKRAAGS